MDRNTPTPLSKVPNPDIITYLQPCNPATGTETSDLDFRLLGYPKERKEVFFRGFGALTFLYVFGYGCSSYIAPGHCQFIAYPVRNLYEILVSPATELDNIWVRVVSIACYHSFIYHSIIQDQWVPSRKQKVALFA